MIRVLIVDDHDLVRYGINRILTDEKGISVVGEANCGEDAIQFIRNNPVDVVLMDVRMPGIGGLEATSKILHISPDTKIVAITACEENIFVNRFLQAGASGFLNKAAGPDEIIMAVKKAHHGVRYISPEIAQRIALQPFQEHDKSPFELLSERELQIALMIVNCEKVNIISDKLFVSSKTVNSYRYRIFEKLGIDGDVALTHLAIRYGLIESNPIAN